MRQFGDDVDFGLTANDYAIHRAGFPPSFFSLLKSQHYAKAGQIAVDLGTGTGTVARGLAQLGLEVTGLDPSESLLAEARALDLNTSVNINYQIGTAEQTGLATGSFDLVTAGQCWHWFDRGNAANEVVRLLRPGGRIIIAHFDWLPLSGNVVDATEALILQYNPAWVGAGGSGLYPAWLTDLAGAGFQELETTSFDSVQCYSHVAWRGRIRASAGIAASLNAKDTKEFDAELAELLRMCFPEDPLKIPHRVWLATGVTSER